MNDFFVIFACGRTIFFAAMYRYFIYTSYNGTRYNGWQRQPNGLSIQQSVEEALSTLLRQTVNIVGAGRTDAGVHAQWMAAHFDLNLPLGDRDHFIRKLNCILPYDIVVERIAQVKGDAHARFDALSRTYRYAITEHKNPFNYEQVYRMSLHGIDFSLMNEACKILFDYTDFTSFSKLHTDTRTNNCHIDYARWEQEGRMWIFSIKADRFLRNMVRAIVGTLLEVGRGKRSLSDFQKVIEGKDRCLAGASVPAKGLMLAEIGYPEELFID